VDTQSLFDSPQWHGVSDSLANLHLQRMNLAGPLPQSLARLRCLRSLWLQDNQLTGTLPSYLAELPHLVDLNLSSNRLRGGLGAVSGSVSLKHLWLEHNRLSGTRTTPST
jgi:hypothetical protein